MRKCKLKKGDDVVVIAGGSKGATGKIDRVLCDSAKVIVSNVNTVKCHRKPSMAHPDGGIVEKSMPLHISNVAIVDSSTKKPTKVGYKISEDGTKSRIARSSGTQL